MACIWAAECFLPPMLPIFVLFLLVLIAALAIPISVGAVYAGRRRTQMRKAFGIPGSSVGDCCLWCWCGPCALAQETRTLWHNNVKDGVCRGPVRTLGAALSEYTPPEVVEVKQVCNDV